MSQPHPCQLPARRQTAFGHLAALGALSLVVLTTACGDGGPEVIVDETGSPESGDAAGGGDAPALGGNDLCPGARVVLHPGADLRLEGDTRLAADDYDVGCSELPDGPDVVFDLAVAGTGTLTVKLRSEEDGYDPTLVLRRGAEQDAACALEAETLLCSSAWETQESFAVDVGPHALAPFDGERYTLIVDGADGQAGRFSLELGFAPPTCGDGVRNQSTDEECDDGNLFAGDGCSPSCTIEPARVSDVCADPLASRVLVEPDAPEMIRGATWGQGDAFEHVAGPSCASEPSGNHDRVIPFVPTVSGRMTVGVGLSEDGFNGACEKDGLATPYCWDARLFITKSDCDGSSADQLVCADDEAFGIERVTFDAVAGEEYFAIVEPVSAMGDGPFNLRFDLDPAP